MYHIVTLSQSMLKEFRQAVYICPSPAPEACHVTSQQQNTPPALTKRTPCRPAAAGSSVLQHRSTRMIHTFATTSTKHMSS